MRRLRIATCAVSLIMGLGLATPALAAGSTVTIQPGNTFWTLSKTYGVSVQALESANPTVNPNNLLVGTTLNLPVNAGDNKGNTVTVEPGDTLWIISQAHGTTVQTLETANPSVNPNNLLVGTVLQLPGSNTSAPSTTTSATATQQQNLYWMEHVINAEAAGESSQAQIAVGDVILHRMEAGYGSTVYDVVFQVLNGHYQFTCVANGYIYTSPSPSSIQAAIDVLDQHTDLVPGAQVFYNPTQTPANSWVRTQPFIAQIDNLVFAK